MPSAPPPSPPRGRCVPTKAGSNAAASAERDREDGVVPMDDVEAEQKRNAEPCLFHRDTLNGMDRPRSPNIEHAADPPRPNALDHAAGQDRAGDGVSCRRHVELADFFLDGHRREELCRS